MESRKIRPTMFKKCCLGLVVIIFISLFIFSSNSAALSNYPSPDDGDLTEAQNIRWEIYVKIVSPSIYQQSSMMYDKVNSEVDWRQGIADLATTLFSNTLSLKSLLNPDITDFQLLTTTIGAELDYIGVISGWDVGNEIADILVTGLKVSLGDVDAFSKFIATKTFNMAVDIYDTFKVNELTDKINHATALNDLLRSYYATGGDFSAIKNFYGIQTTDCANTNGDFNCIAKFISQSYESYDVDYSRLYEDAGTMLRHVNRVYNGLESLEPGNSGLDTSPWPIFRSNVIHSGLSSYQIPYSPVKKWDFLADYQIRSSPIIGNDGTIYFGTYSYSTYNGHLYALYPNGDLRWKFPASRRITSSPAIGADGTVFIGLSNGNFYAVNSDGTEKWSYSTGSSVDHSSPVIAPDGTIYIGIRSGKLLALNPDGSLKWQFSSGDASGGIDSSPAIASDGTLYLTTINGYVYAINPSGSLIWKYHIGGNNRIYSSPSIGKEGEIYFGTSHRDSNINSTAYFYSLYPDGTYRWRVKLSGELRSSPAIAEDGAIYVGSNATYRSQNSYLHKISKNGKLIWKYYINGSVYSSPAIDSGGTIYVGSQNNCFYAFRSDKSIKWNYCVAGDITSSPAIGVDGTIYFGSHDKHLYALGFQGDEGEVYGQVLDSGTLEPIVGAVISSGEKSVVSDSLGMYGISLEQGNHELNVSSAGYQLSSINNIFVVRSSFNNINVELNKDAPFNIVLSSLLPVEKGVLYNDKITASGGTLPYRFAIAYGSLPPGLVLDSINGEIAGTPTTVGSYTFAVSATDTDITYAEREFTIEVTDALIINSPALLPRATLGGTYNFSLDVKGGAFPYEINDAEPHYYQIIDSSTTWNSAKTSCEDSSGYLVTITSAVENSAVEKLAQEWGRKVWIGFSDLQSEGDWEWVTGEPVLFTQWYANQPNNVNYDCAYLWERVQHSTNIHSDLWVEQYCSYKRPYMCEYQLLPNGIYIDSDGNIRGTPLEVGSYEVQLVVSDSSGRSIKQTFILNVDNPLLIKTYRLNDGIVGEVYNQVLAASGGYGDYEWDVYSGVLPDGLFLDSASGVISGTPAEATFGTIVLSATDECGRITYKDITLQISDPLTILTTTLPNGLRGEQFSEAIRLDGGIGPFIFSSAGQLPAGLILDTNMGIISGTPTTAGYTNVSITVVDSTYPTTRSVTQNLGIRVTSQLTILSSAVLPMAKKGIAINPIVLVAGGGPSPYNWSFTDGYMPEGITLNTQTGELSGTPADKGDFIFKMQVTDANASTAGKEFFMHISGELEIVTSAIPDAAKSTSYSYTLEGSGGLLPYNWRIKSGTLPSGLSFNTTTGTIYGRPTTRQSYSFTVEVSDSDSPAQTAERTYNMEVLDSLYIYTNTLSNGSLDKAYTSAVTAALGVPPYNWRLSGGVLPPGLNLTGSPNAATIEGLPTTIGSYVFTIEVTDSDTSAKTSTQEYTVDIYEDVIIETMALMSADRGVPYSDDITVSGGELPYTWELIEGDLPVGLRLNSTTGHISGTSNLVSGHSSSFAVRVTDSGNPYGFDEKEFVINVIDLLSIVTESIEDAMQGEYYETPFVGEGGVSPVNWAIQSGNIPDGLQLDAGTGVISGTPRRCGVFPFTVILEDSDTDPNTDMHEYNLNVLCSNDYVISGIISNMQGVVVALNGDAPMTTTTDTQGAFKFEHISNGNYTVTPSIDGYKFTPASTDVLIDGFNRVDIGFAAAACANIYYRDADGDKYGNPSISTLACSVPSGYVTNNNDCDDNDRDRFPGNPEVCDGKDNDCDGPIDENLTQPTTCGTGECAGNMGTETCTAGTWGNNSCDPLSVATSEVCDNKDNDCDGTFDEDLTQPTTCGAGECSGNKGIETCTAGAWGNDSCDSLAGSTVEICDNKDNDCDGSIDEDLTQSTTCGTGECAGNTGVETCTTGVWGNDTCDPLAGAIIEVCDGIDNDCDGSIDEECSCLDNDSCYPILGSDANGYYFSINEGDGTQSFIAGLTPGMAGLEMVGTTLYAGSSSGGLYLIDLDSGAVTLIGTGGFNISGLGYDGTDLYGSSGNGFLFRINMTTGSQSDWLFNDIYSLKAMTYYKGTLYVSEYGGRLSSLDTSNGKITVIGSGDYEIDSLTVFNGVMYGGNADGQFFSIDMADGSHQLINGSTNYQLDAMAVTVAIEPLSYDTDQNWQIGDFELLDAIDAWVAGNLGDFELLDLIDYWAAGSYCWNTGQDKYFPRVPDGTGVCTQ